MKRNILTIQLISIYKTKEETEARLSRACSGDISELA